MARIETFLKSVNYVEYADVSKRADIRADAKRAGIASSVLSKCILYNDVHA